MNNNSNNLSKFLSKLIASVDEVPLRDIYCLVQCVYHCIYSEFSCKIPW